MLIHSRDALQAVKSLAFQRIPVAVSSNYKGLFFEEKVAPLKVGPDYIVFKAPKPQICLSLRYQVWLHPPNRRSVCPCAIKSGCILKFYRNRCEPRCKPFILPTVKLR